MRETVLTIGNFDGVHLGHRAILRRAREVADRRGAIVRAITFHPSPAKVLRPGSEPPQLADLNGRTALLREAGADEVLVVEPTPALLSLTPVQFLEGLVEKHRPAAVVEGPNFRFGKGRSGGVETLTEHGGRLGFETVVVEPVTVTLSDLLVAPVSSSVTRWLLGHGRVMDAGRCLGREYEVTAPVVEGEKRGRTLGTPTANLDLEALEGRMIPAEGVYGGRAVLDDGSGYAAAISIGRKPTLGRMERTLEAHLLGFSGELYGRAVTLTFGRWLREQQWFPSLEHLKAQIGRDVAAAGRD